MIWPRCLLHADDLRDNYIVQLRAKCWYEDVSCFCTHLFRPYRTPAKNIIEVLCCVDYSLQGERERERERKIVEKRCVAQNIKGDAGNRGTFYWGLSECQPSPSSFTMLRLNILIAPLRFVLEYRLQYIFRFIYFIWTCMDVASLYIDEYSIWARIISII